VSIRHKLAGFVALQQLLTRRAALVRQRDLPPEELARLRARYDERQGALQEHGKEREALLAEQVALETEIAALQEEREHFRRQKAQVTNMRQLSAVVSELDHVESRLTPKKDRLTEVRRKLDEAEAKLADLEAETPEEKAERELAEEAWGVARQAGEAELGDVERELRRLQRELGEPAMTQFKKLWTSRKPHAVVPLDGHACSSCHADLRPSLVQLVRSMEELQTCDSCRRLLYDPEQLPKLP
jgi:predicted  nucleic acid-binding Zn-ribbon protein